MTNSTGNLSEEVILATGGYDHTIKLWQLNDGVCKRTAQHTDSKRNNKKSCSLKEQCERAIVQAKKYLQKHPNSINRISIDCNDKESYISQKIIRMIAMDIIKEEKKNKKKKIL